MLLAVPLAPLVGAVVAGFFGKAIGRAGAHTVTILGVLIAFVISVAVLIDVNAGARFNATIYEWMRLGDLGGQVFVFFILTVAAAESAIGLAILVVLFRNRSTINVEELDTLKG